MRIALHVVGEVGRRAGRILLAERALTALGLYGQEGGPTEERRTMAIKDLVGFDLLVTDAIEDASAFATRAADEGIPCVLSVEKVSRGSPTVSQHSTSHCSWVPTSQGWPTRWPGTNRP